MSNTIVQTETDRIFIFIAVWHPNAIYPPAYPTFEAYMAFAKHEVETSDTSPVNTLNGYLGKGKHTAKVLWAGLTDEGLPTEHIVPYVTDKPAGYFAPQTRLYSTIINTDGSPNKSVEQVRADSELRAVIESNYLNGEIPEDLIIDKVKTGNIDQIILMLPPYYPYPQFNFQISSYAASLNYQNGEKTYTLASWQPFYSEAYGSRAILHEFLHKNYNTNKVFFGRPVSNFVYDMYTRPGTEYPYNGNPCPACIMSNHQSYILNPIAKFTMNIIEDIELVDQDGNITITHYDDTQYAVAIRSRYDKHCYLIICYEPKPNLARIPSQWDGIVLISNLMIWVVKVPRNGVVGNNTLPPYTVAQILKRSASGYPGMRISPVQIGNITYNTSYFFQRIGENTDPRSNEIDNATYTGIDIELISENETTGEAVINVALQEPLYMLNLFTITPHSTPINTWDGILSLHPSHDINVEYFEALYTTGDAEIILPLSTIEQSDKLYELCNILYGVDYQAGLVACDGEGESVMSTNKYPVGIIPWPAITITEQRKNIASVDIGISTAQGTRTLITEVYSDSQYTSLVMSDTQSIGRNPVLITVNGLPDGATYYVRTRTELNGTDNISPWKYKTLQSRTTFPTTSLATKVSAYTHADSIHIDHEEVYEATSYLISLTGDGVETIYEKMLYEYTNGVCTISGLQPETQYTIKICPKRDALVGTWSATSTNTTQEIYPPTLGGTQTVESTIITISIVPPTNLDTDANSYEMVISEDSGFNSIFRTDNILTPGTVRVKDLSPDTLYYIKARAEYANHVSDWSNVITGSTRSADIEITSLIPYIDSIAVAHTINPYYDAYMIEVSNMENMANPIIYDTTAQDYVDGVYVCTADQAHLIQRDTQYYIRVTGIVEGEYLFATFAAAVKTLRSIVIRHENIYLSVAPDKMATITWDKPNEIYLSKDYRITISDYGISDDYLYNDIVQDRQFEYQLEEDRLYGITIAYRPYGTSTYLHYGSKKVYVPPDAPKIVIEEVISGEEQLIIKHSMKAYATGYMIRIAPVGVGIDNINNYASYVVDDYVGGKITVKNGDDTINIIPNTHYLVRVEAYGLNAVLAYSYGYSYYQASEDYTVLTGGLYEPTIVNITSPTPTTMEVVVRNGGNYPLSKITAVISQQENFAVIEQESFVQLADGEVEGTITFSNLVPAHKYYVKIYGTAEGVV